MMMTLLALIASAMIVAPIAIYDPTAPNLAAGIAVAVIGILSGALLDSDYLL